MTDKYVSDMNPAELRAHMHRLKAMSGWHDPLSDALYAEIQRMDDAAPSASAQQAEPVYDTSVVKRIATQMGWTPPTASPAALTDERFRTLHEALEAARYGDMSKKPESPCEKQERAGFENEFSRLERERDATGNYDRHLTRLAWQGWLARALLAASPAAQGEDARDALMLELLESYEAIFRSAYCQLDADDDLIRRVRAAMSASKEPK